MKGFIRLLKICVALAACVLAAAFGVSSASAAPASAHTVTVNPVSVQENQGFSGVIAHVDSCDDHCSSTVYWGDGTTTVVDPTGVDISASHIWVEEGNYTVRVDATSWGCFIFCVATGTATGSRVETIADAPLTTPSNQTLSLAEGVVFNGVVGSFTDANGTATADDFTATIRWGDTFVSSGTVAKSGSRWNVSGTHTYRMAGTYSIVTAVNDHGSSINIPATANVTDVALTASGVNESWTAGQSSTLKVASFTDANPGAIASDFTATISWGDGSSSPGAISGGPQFSVNGTHTYANAGTYTATISIHDAGGASATATAQMTVTGFTLLPALSNGAYGGYTTTIYLKNAGSAAADIHIVYYDATGKPVGVDANASLAPNATWIVPQTNGHSFDPGTAGSGLVLSSQPLAAFVNEFAPGGSDATSYTGINDPVQTGSTLYVPAIANNAYGGYTTGIGLLNLGTPGNITITYRDNLGVVALTQVLPNVATYSYNAIYSGTAGLPANFAGTATITGPGRMAAVINEVGPNGQFSSYDAVNAGSTTLNAPAALNNAYGGFYTGMGIQNTSNTAGTVTVDYYDATGAKTTTTQSIAANGYIGLFQGSSTEGPPANPLGYTAVITGSQPLAVIVNETAPPVGGLTTMSTSYNTFTAGKAQSHLALVENAGPDGWSTGLGVMNTGSTATTVTLSYYDATTGAPIGNSQTQTLQPKAFYGPYQPAAGLPPGVRASAVLTTTTGGQVAVICNEAGPNMFMSYDGQ